MISVGRRAVLAGGAAAVMAPRLGWAQSGPIPLAALVPLSGAVGAYGPTMAKAAKAVVDQVNAAGGILGRQIALSVVDSQTNPRAQRRLSCKQR